MNPHIQIALEKLKQTIREADGPLYTDADRGRVLRHFMGVVAAMDNSDLRFEAQAAEAKRVLEAERRRIEGEELRREVDSLGYGDDQ